MTIKRRIDNIQNEDSMVNIPVDADCVEEFEHYILDYLSEHEMSVMEINIAVMDVLFKAQYIAAQQYSSESLSTLNSFIN